MSQLPARNRSRLRPRPREPAPGERQIGRSQGTRIREVVRPEELRVVRTLFAEYARWLELHREVTDFDSRILSRGLEGLQQEIATLPGPYAPPSGALFLAFVGRVPAGCTALRRQRRTVGELKRVYLRPQFRGAGLGRRLTLAALRKARGLGYRAVVLDTLPKMTEAAAMYRSLGFRPIPAYWAHHVPGALFFQYDLAGRHRPREATLRTTRSGSTPG
jgi:GNAT superfamily N-acetyltransferase